MAPKAKPSQTTPLSLYDELVAAHGMVERRGAAMPYTSLNGNMFSFLTKEGTLALRLPDGEREAFLKKYKAKLVEQHGAVLEEYVAVPGALLGKTAELQPYFALSFDYARTLKPKPTR